MSEALLIVRYRLSGDAASFRESMEAAAPAILSAAGLRWKLWGLDPESGCGLSVYLFDSPAAAAAFAAGPMIARPRQRPDIREVSMESAPVDRRLSDLTGAGPVLATAAARERPDLSAAAS